MSDAEITLRNVLGEIFAGKSNQIALKLITSGGANYTSALYTADVTTNGENLNLFIKIAIVGEKMRARMNADSLYGTERLVYTELAQAYDALQDKYNILPEFRFVFPKFYGCSAVYGEETIVLEDLVKEGFTIHNRFKSIDWEMAESAVSAMARFHAISFAYQKECPDDFDKVVDKVKNRMVIDENDEDMKAAWAKMIGGAIAVLNEDHRERMGKFMGSEMSTQEFMKFRMPLNRTVLTHGDYRTSNLMFRKQNGVLETMVVDYQTVHAGSPVVDLLYFIFTGSDAHFRRYHYRQLLDFYYQELTAALARMRIDINDVYPREMFDDELKEMLPSALRWAVALLPIVCVAAEHAPQVAGDADVDSFALQPTELFADRFSGLVADCVQWGVL